MSRRVPALVLLLTACAPADPGADDVPVVPGPADIARPADGWLRGDLHFHTNFSDDALEQGGDWMGPALAIADAWRDEVWTAANPDLSPDDHLQFIAVTDHRTVAGLSDPDYTHPYLALLGGEEFGSDGHAGIWGLGEHVPHEPQAGESARARMDDAITEAHDQGALFSVNHPTYAGDLWTWNVEGIDAVEVWNGPWSLLGTETEEAELDAWIAGRDGLENPAIRVALRVRGGGQNAQAVRFWQALLSLGVHVPPVGGSDRHMLFPAGLPTTYVAAVAQTEPAVLDGLASGQTFVSRSPQGPQVVLEAEVGGTTYPMGAALPAGAGPVTVRWRVGRAAGGTITLLGAAVDPAMPDPVALATVTVDGDDDAGAFTWNPPAGGGWLHAVVTDPLPTPDSPELQALADQLSEPSTAGGVAGILGALGGMVEIGELSAPAYCDPRQWSPLRFQCMPADTEPFGTFYIPMALQPWLALERVDTASTGAAMGALSAAFLVPPP